MEKTPSTSRRDFIATTGKITAASALAGVALPYVHGAVDDTVRVALVGCGGRGTGAADNALSVSAAHGPTKLVAMADVFDDKVKGSHNALSKKHGKEKVDVPADRQYVGFDAYKHAIDGLRKGDIAIFTTPPAFRWVFFQYAVQKGVNVFMEKPVTADGFGTKKILEINKEAKRKNLKVAVGLMCRHSRARTAMAERIQNGDIGDIVLMRSYRMHGPVASAHSIPRAMSPEFKDMEEIRWQIRRFHSFIWASGGLFNDFYIHNIDECCWMKGAAMGDPNNSGGDPLKVEETREKFPWPVMAQATGGKHYVKNGQGQPYVDQNFDSYSVEYTYADGTKLMHYGRTIEGCHNEFASYVHGTKGFGVFSQGGHFPAPSALYKGQTPNPKNQIWKFPVSESNPYQDEWDDLLDAVRNDKPYNEADRGALASQVCNMGRMAAHTGQRITWDMALNAEPLAGNLDKLMGFDSKAPVLADANGFYPVPQPGIKKDREY
ncbi:MAG: Gfo/Idh/MocA family oxidoreductase [Pedosphaera sp.]|nr:Gfo/Idh/MocA family oxidoreductase [Pedosphaera sp.]MSU44224.1 Gfo/Idh/MocA family oxidoreductase [Pedosphaera sp.]